MKKSAWVMLILVSSVTFLFSFMRPKESLYKNLKVLPKDISKEDMDSVMRHFTMSLGVRCNFCHVRMDNEKHDWDFASDSLRHKETAREMMKMTAKINDKFFKHDIKNIDMPQMNEVTCNTCHNGREHPRRKPEQQPRPGERPGPPPGTESKPPVGR